ncbi:hypothetical protein FF38_02738 [Lucilia cuprina]|uniref:Secreted protein n=1 Tax=Lucilia cuprina TaxID=7375 RepID=A0A0L0CQ53_LUCCU|nr:hypothetical protein CVS40_0764 [Lucilia cuprina]KNC34495.1 hypothetical protein FF38_02738 [Lucilia cuprina]
MKLTLIFLVICALGFSQAQLNLGLNLGPKAGFAGLSPGQFFQNIVLQSEAEKLLVNPDLPDDLRQRVLDSMANAEQGFNNCSTAVTLPWMQIRCSALQLQRSKNELKAIENEATARAQAAANAAPVETGTAII